jgi:predicted nucleic acid-binding Zn ribbon protein
MEPQHGPEPVGEILSRLFTARGWGRLQDRLRIEKAWAEAAGPDIAPKTRVVALKRGTLEVEVRGPILLQELAQFHKRRILEALRKGLAGVKVTDLRFRTGLWDNGTSH